MAKKNRASSGPTQQRRSSTSFFTEHNDLWAALLGPPGHEGSGALNELASSSVSPHERFIAAVNQLKQTPFSRILETSGRDNSPEAFKEILELLIRSLGVETPIGVFTPSQKTGRHGRPISSEGERIYSRWVEIGEPSPFRNDLAQAYYGALFSKASGTDRRKMRDKCRQALDRHFDRLIADLEVKIARQAEETAKLREQVAQAEMKLAERRAIEP